MTNKILRVGDNIEILIDAFDPKGRKITYSYIWGDLENSTEENYFSITINKSMIDKQSELRIVVKTEETEYKNSDLAFIFYTVLP